MNAGIGADADRRTPPGRPGRPARVEPRWPAVLAVLAVLVLLAMLPARVRLLPPWGPYVVGIALLGPMSGVWLSRGDPRWLRTERVLTLVFSLLAEAVNFLTLSYLIVRMLGSPADLSGRQLLMSSVGAWVTNVLVFSIAYWQIDRGGPEDRANDTGPRPDWLFPQTGVPDEAPPGWRPTFVDYLYLSFTTATAFSTTEVAPLTSRAKMLMMAESAVSLSTLVVVASRAINILGA
jgi:hypothetical protein